MPSNGDSYNDQFKMSGAGSPRYMAPEVFGSEPTYNLKADVYTFCVVLWEVLALEKPYAFVRSRQSLIDHVGETATDVLIFYCNCNSHPDLTCFLRSDRRWSPTY